MVNQDFSNLWSEFNAQRVEYHVMGAHALAAHGHIRAAKDRDVWERPSPGIVFQIGVVPPGIDIRTHIDGVTFNEAWDDRELANCTGIPVKVLSRTCLIHNKHASRRKQGLTDVGWPENLQA